MGRATIKVITCDGCGKRVDHNYGALGIGSGWFPVGWTELVRRVDERTDDTRHLCETCSTAALTPTRPESGGGG